MIASFLRTSTTRLVAGASLAALMAGQGIAQDAETLTIALGVNINTLDPHMTASVASDLSLLSHIYPALVLRGPDLKLKPALAESWDAVDDSTWRFNLVEGAAFSNGEPLDAEAVKWNIERVQDPEVGARIAGWFKAITAVNVVDATTVELITEAPYPALADQLSMFFLLPPKWASENNPAADSVSGGPYMITENVPGDHISLTVNPDYWGETPAVENVVFRTIPESGSQIAAMLADEVDWIAGMPTTELQRITDSGIAKGDAIDSTRSMLVKLNHEKPPVDDVKFRQAINYAIDKEGITQAVFDGYASVSNCQIMMPAYFGYNPDLKPYPYDPEKARDLLAESGLDLSQEIELDVPVGRYLQAEEVGQIVAAMLTDVGLNIKITEMDFGSFMAKQVKVHDMAQLAVLGLAWPTIDADGILTMFEPGNVYDYWGNEEFGALLAEGRSSTDPAKREAIYMEATKLMCDEAGSLFLYQQPLTYGLSDDFTWAARGDDWIRAMDMTPAK